MREDGTSPAASSPTRPAAPLGVRPATFDTVPFAGHALLDSGGGWKLERFGQVVLARPDPQALWRRRCPDGAWEAADLTFVRESDRGGRWRPHRRARPEARGEKASWDVDVLGATLAIRPTPFKHVGLFPEQASNWSYVARQRERVARADDATPRLLNLFAYTGAATVLAAQAGYAVTHVDASKLSLRWARENAERSGLASDAVRWIPEDALTFVRREVRRGNRYAGILLDPPHYGRGPKGEKWVLEEGLAPLLEACAELLEPASFLVLSSYAVGVSPLAFVNLLEELPGGRVEAGELVLQEVGEERGQRDDPQRSPRLLPCGFCARWSR